MKLSFSSSRHFYVYLIKILIYTDVERHVGGKLRETKERNLEKNVYAMGIE